MYYVYVLLNADGFLYIGYTNDLKRRYNQHVQGCSQATKHKQYKLVYYEAYLSEEDARRRERKLKDGRAKYHLLQRIRQSKNDAFET